jgi:transmembrane sensor
MTNDSMRDNTPDDPELWDTLARYLAGESSPDETAQVRAWLAADPSRAELLDALNRSLSTIAAAPENIDVEAALRRVSARIDEPAVHAIEAARDRKQRAGRPPVWLAWAAAVAAVLLGTTLLVQLALNPRSTRTPALTANTYEASIGAVDSVRLADGTRVLLAPGSRIVVAAGYGATTHDVTLSGEALFDVAKSAAGRFTVRAGSALIRDLGTTFTVHSDDGAEVRVVVTSGSVALRAATATDSGTVLRAGDRGVLAADGRVSVERGSASDVDLAWTSGRLVFDNATLAHVAVELRRWYGFELQFADSALARRTFRSSFSGEAVDSVLAEIELALGDVDIERTGNNTAVVRAK